MNLIEWLPTIATATTWRDRKRLRETLTDSMLIEAEEWQDKDVDMIIDHLFQHPYHSFEPRQNNIQAGDEQEGFVDSQSLISVALGGNGSGKTFTAAQKLIEFVANTPPPTKDTPFWIIANSYEQACSTCWHQKLRTLLPKEWVDQDRITWYSSKREWPYSVPLKPRNPREPDKNWVLEFKSYEQGMAAMSASAIGGAWFTEQFPFEIFEEVLRGVREYAFPGSIFMEFTPIDPEKSVDMQNLYEDWLVGDEKTKNWSFYHLNTAEAVKAGHADETWFNAFFGTISEEMQETRMHGAFASYEGSIYKSFVPQIHLVDEMEVPPGCFHKRAIDWGASEEHPFYCVWGAKDAMGTWYIYDEYWSISQTALIDDHAKEIKDRHYWDPTDYHHFLNTYGDPSRPDLFREYGNRGIGITSANNDVNEGIETVRRLLKIHPQYGPRIYINRKACPKLARQMATYRWHKSSGKGINPKAAKPVPLKVDDDAVDGLRYLLHSDYKGDTGRGAKAQKIEPPKRESVRHERHALAPVNLDRRF